jgi:hypothetical protein
MVVEPASVLVFMLQAQRAMQLKKIKLRAQRIYLV